MSVFKAKINIGDLLESLSLPFEMKHDGFSEIKIGRYELSFIRHENNYIVSKDDSYFLEVETIEDVVEWLLGYIRKAKEHGDI